MFLLELPIRPEAFGFKDIQGGAHNARTLMLRELTRLLEATPLQAARQDYRTAVVEHNVLGKGTYRSRRLTFDHLVALYGLDGHYCLFRAARRLWRHDAAARPLLALQLALARDGLLRESAARVVPMAPGETLDTAAMMAFFEDRHGHRFTPNTLRSLAQNVNSSWTQAGFLHGVRRKVRRQPAATPANAAYALLQGYLTGCDGALLLGSGWCRLLGQPRETLLALCYHASVQGLLVFRRTGEVMEFRFPGYLTPEEERWRNEPH
ncbi:MAG: hypothetical protein M3Z21_16495 [Pseudomonadota bacterium]|nr:hypothetical protein [Pseudomonadota bacterium]